MSFSIEDICEDLHYHGYYKAVDTIERFSADIHNYRGFPEKHWKKISTTNMMERVNKEIKRRSRVVGAFPSDASLIRLIGSILMDMNEEWVRQEAVNQIATAVKPQMPPNPFWVSLA